MVPLLLDAVKQMTVKITCQVVIVGELLCQPKDVNQVVWKMRWHTRELIELQFCTCQH